MSSTNYIQTFYAGEALAAKRRVKINTASPATTTDPPEVVYSDAGEDYIGVTEYAAASPSRSGRKPGRCRLCAGGGPHADLLKHRELQKFGRAIDYLEV